MVVVVVVVVVAVVVRLLEVVVAVVRLPVVVVVVRLRKVGEQPLLRPASPPSPRTTQPGEDAGGAACPGVQS